MDMMQHLLRLFSYDDWANREALVSLKMSGTPPTRSLRFMAHIVGAEWLWLARLKREKKAVVVWPDLTLDQCEGQITDLARLWQDYLGGLTLPKLSESTAYINTQGESWTNTVGDVLMHVVMHSAYHRGQIATDLRASGHTSAYTDFIHCIRQGYVQ
jgi:uncharacterized damage-inducible protein DinB